MNNTGTQDIELRGEQAALALGHIIGQLSTLLNALKTKAFTQDEIYYMVKDIWQAAGLHLHGVYYQDNCAIAKQIKAILDRLSIIEGK